MIDSVTAVLLLWMGLIISSCLFAHYVCLYPPKAKYNPLAVLFGIIMTLVFVSPSQYIACKLQLEFLSLIIPYTHFATSLGIMAMAWSLKHNIEEVDAVEYKKLYHQED